MTSNTPITSPSPWIQAIEKRKQRADYFFDNILAGQRRWYSAKAGKQKIIHLTFAIMVIVLGALITLLQVLPKAEWVSMSTALLGAAVAVMRAVDTLLKPNETWQAYRKASENMKREYRLYLNNADVYGQEQNEEAAYRLLVERVETVIAEEQELYWQARANAKAAETDTSNNEIHKTESTNDNKTSS